MADRGPAFPRFFDAAALGASLKEVSNKLIKAKDREIVNRWFHSARDADLFIWLDQHNEILKQQLSFYGQIVEWNVVEGLKTGFVCEQESEDRRSVKSSEVVQFDTTPQPRSVEQAKALLEQITALEMSERKRLLVNFSEAPRLHQVDPEEFVRRFGLHLDAPKAPPSVQVTFWAWIKTLLRTWLRR